MKSSIELYVIQQVKKKRKEFCYSQAELFEKLERASGFIGQVERKKCAAKYKILIVE